MTTNNPHESSIDDLEQETYRRQLLHQYKTTSKYGEQWQHLKRLGKVSIVVNTKLNGNPHKVAIDALNRLYHKDQYFMEYCWLTYQSRPAFKSTKLYASVLIELDYNDMTSTSTSLDDKPIQTSLLLE